MLNTWKSISEHTKVQIIKWAYLVIVVAATITMSILVYQNKNIVSDIQQDRKRVTYDLCLDQNSRHSELIDFVKDTQLAKARLAAKKEGKQLPTEPPPVDPTTKKFIDLLAPKRDCKQVVINIFGSPIDESS